MASGAPGLAQWRTISVLLNVRPARLPGEGGDPLNNLPLRPQRSAYGPESPTLADERREADRKELEALPVMDSAHS